VIDLLLPRAGTIIPEAGARNRALTAPAVIVDPLALVPDPGAQDLTGEGLDGWAGRAGIHDTIADEAPLRVRRYALIGLASIAVGAALALAFAARPAPLEGGPTARPYQRLSPAAEGASQIRERLERPGS
jgi:hypothetical protein